MALSPALLLLSLSLYFLKPLLRHYIIPGRTPFLGDYSQEKSAPRKSVLEECPRKSLLIGRVS
jgi:hypothetical protein